MHAANASDCLRMLATPGLGAPVLVDIRTYPVKVMDGTVYIDLEA